MSAPPSNPPINPYLVAPSGTAVAPVNCTPGGFPFAAAFPHPVQAQFPAPPQYAAAASTNPPNTSAYPVPYAPYTPNLPPAVVSASSMPNSQHDLVVLPTVAVAPATPSAAPTTTISSPLPPPPMDINLLIQQATTIVNEHMKENHLVGVAVCLCKDGQILYEGGFGYADKESGERVGPHTKFRWGSISKTLTATLAMQLYEEGLLNLDADVSAHYVPEFPKKKLGIITPRLLLCHQAGITRGPLPDRGDDPAARYGTPYPYADVICALDQFKDERLEHRPGAMFAYSNFGFLLLGAVCQRAARTGESFAQLVLRKVAARAGLETLAPDWPWDKQKTNMAKGYNTAGERTRNRDGKKFFNLPAAHWASTVRDLAKFGMAFVEHRLMKPETRALVMTPQPTALPPHTETMWGLGWSLAGKKKWGVTVVSHNGQSNITSTTLIILPDQNTVCAVMSNTSPAKPGKLAWRLLRLALPSLAQQTAKK